MGGFQVRKSPFKTAPPIFEGFSLANVGRGSKDTAKKVEVFEAIISSATERSGDAENTIKTNINLATHVAQTKKNIKNNRGSVPYFPWGNPGCFIGIQILWFIIIPILNG